MAIDRNLRARLGARLRQDNRLTHAETRAAHALLFGCLDGRTGRTQAYRARIAREGAVSLRSVDRALERLKSLGYLEVIATYGPRHRAAGGRWFRPRGASVYVWRDDFLTARTAAPPRQESIPRATPALLPAELVSALARLGHAIADQTQKPAPPAPQ